MVRQHGRGERAQRRLFQQSPQADPNNPLLGTLGPFRNSNVCGILAPTPESLPFGDWRKTVSASYRAYVGPYACFLVPRGRAVPRIEVRAPPDEEGEEHFVLECNAGPDFQNLLPTLVVNRREVEAYCYMPALLTRGPSDRELHFWEWVKVPSVADDLSVINIPVDLAAIDQEAEVQWFAAAYTAELKQLKKAFALYTRSFQIRWGVVVWEGH
jgi:hypothetical protein